MKPMKKGLGKGLSALIPGDDMLDFGQHSIAEVLELPLNEIKPNSEQPRRQFNEESIASLAESIKNHGVVQPILVSRIDDMYMIIAGERRWRAAHVAGLTNIPAIVRTMDDLKLAQISLIENIQREDLSDVEEARAYRLLIDNFNLKQDEVADSVGKSRSYVANTLRLLKLEVSIQDKIVEGKISGGHGRVLLRETNPVNQLKWADLIIQKGISVRELEKLIVKPNKIAKNIKLTRNELSYETIQFEQDLKDVFGTKVVIQHKENKGKIEIEYYGLDEFDRIMKILKK
jgi:ParB family chromosome partitioning protein